MLVVVVLLVLLTAGVFVVGAVGSLLPPARTTSRTARFRQPPEALWHVITNYPGHPRWRPELQAVERLPDHEGRPVWREVDRRGRTLSLETVESIPPLRLVRHTMPAGAAVRTVLTYELLPSPEGTLLTITEYSETYNPVLRLLAYLFADQAGPIEGHLRALGRHLGEEAAIGQ